MTENNGKRKIFGMSKPCCCMAGCGGAATVALMVIGITAFFLMKTFRENDAYRQALKMVQGNSEVQSRLGVPITDTMFVFGSIEVKNDTGYAAITAPVKGPNGAAGLSVTAVKADGDWVIENLVVVFEDQTTLVLVGGGDEASEENDAPAEPTEFE